MCVCRLSFHISFISKCKKYEENMKEKQKETNKPDIMQRCSEQLKLFLEIWFRYRHLRKQMWTCVFFLELTWNTPLYIFPVLFACPGTNMTKWQSAPDCYSEAWFAHTCSPLSFVVKSPCLFCLKQIWKEMCVCSVSETAFTTVIRTGNPRSDGSVWLCII